MEVLKNRASMMPMQWRWLYQICLWQHVLVELLKAGIVHIFAVSNIHRNFYSLSDPVEESSQSQGYFCHLAHEPGFI